jgi:yecA family protein
MTDLVPVRFDDLCDLLLPLGTLNSPSELHGLLCGKLSGGEALSETRWLLDAVEFLDFTQAPDESVRNALAQLYLNTSAQLRSQSFDLALMLPEDDVEIAQRLKALSEWCYGFLTGFGSAGVGRQTLSEDAQDTLRDLASIAQIEVDEDGGNEAEADYMEVTEYLRMAVNALYLEFAADKPDVQKTPTGSLPPSSSIH